MCATRRGRLRQRGSTMVATVMLLIMMAGFSLLLVASAQATHREVSARLDAMKAFYVAEGGLDLAISQIGIDQYWPIVSESRFPTLIGTTELESVWIPLGEEGGDFKVVAQYQDADGVALDVSDRTEEPRYDQIEIRVVGRSGAAQRTIRARLQFEIQGFDSAIVSDSPLIGTASGSGKGLAKDHGTVCFDAPNQYVYGGVRANAGVYAGSTSTPITEDNKTTELDAFTGEVHSELYGTADEVPDFTDPGSAEQLFEFARFRAAAAAGAGAVYSGLDELRTAANAANAAGTPLEGIIYVEVDAAVEGGSPKLKDNEIPGGINVKGTLVFDFENVGDDFYKVFIECPLNINAATLPSPFDPSDESHLLTGYPPTISESKDPRGFEMHSATYEDFPADADMPALMFDTGTVDIHDAANVCGAVYGPSFIEIENNRASLQYFNGIIIGGSGVYLKGKVGTGSAQVFVYDSAAVNALPTFQNRAKVPTRSGYLIDE